MKEGKIICKSSGYKGRSKHWSYFVAKQRMCLQHRSCAWAAGVWERNPRGFRCGCEERGLNGQAELCFLWGGDVFVSVTMTRGRHNQSGDWATAAQLVCFAATASFWVGELVPPWKGLFREGFLCYGTGRTHSLSLDAPNVTLRDAGPLKTHKRMQPEALISRGIKDHMLFQFF